MKKNRSNKFTQGIVITNNTNNLRFLFFELDKPLNPAHVSRVIDVYKRFGSSFLIHRSWNGLHFIGIRLFTVETWKEAMSELKEINKKCPQTTLRWLPNKFPMESEIWFSNECWIDPNSNRYNSDELSKLLNHTFGSDFEGSIHTDLKFVRYPLP